MTSVGGVIPAAGRSERMGRPKALLDPGGTSFLERVAHALLDGGCAPVVVVVRDPADAVARAARRLGLPTFCNPDPADGPISSLRAGLHALPASVDGCAWCPVDYPLIRTDTVAELVAAFGRHPDAVVMPAHDGHRGHPVIVPRSLFPSLHEPGLPEGARSVIRRPDVRVVTVPVDDPGILIDVDTPEDLDGAFPPGPGT